MNIKKMNNFKTTVLIVNYNTSDFISVSLYALTMLTRHNFKVYIVDNNSQLDDYEKLKRIVAKYDNVYMERHETKLRGSMAHGTALNHLVKKVDTPYFSILDADATWLKKDWDELCINLMSDKIKVVGTQACGDKPKDFPLMFAILFETEAFRELNVDFRPQDIKAKQDTGFEIRKKYLKAGYKGVCLELKNTRYYKNGPFNKLIGVGEYYLNQNYKSIVASHFGRGSSLGANKYYRGLKKYIYAIPMLGKYLLRKKGLKEKQEWISICHDIINNQL